MKEYAGKNSLTEFKIFRSLVINNGLGTGLIV